MPRKTNPDQRDKDGVPTWVRLLGGLLIGTDPAGPHPLTFLPCTLPPPAVWGYSRSHCSQKADAPAEMAEQEDWKEERFILLMMKFWGDGGVQSRWPRRNS